MSRCRPLALPTACLYVFAGTLVAQKSTQPAPQAPQPTIQVQSNLVVVPALVQDPEGNVVYSLTADDFSLEDNGVIQKITLEDELDPAPLALVVAIQSGANGERQQQYLAGLSTMIEDLGGSHPVQIAVVAFGREPALAAPFSTNRELTREKLQHPPSVGGGSAIIDAVAFSLQVLDGQPKQYRKAILLISETRDHGSRTTRSQMVEALARSNTAVYSVAFSPAMTQWKDALTQPGHINKPLQVDPLGPTTAYFDFTPLMMMAINGMRSNSAEEVAGLSGGEYIRFDNRRELDRSLNTIANHLPNRYLLTFQPSATQPGLHSINVRVKHHPDWSVTARSSYWAADR
jgi:VWFA-related protein